VKYRKAFWNRDYLLRSAILLLGLFILLILLFARNTGVHIDESFYLATARFSPLGDSVEAGKPPLFYAINYHIHNELSPLIGQYHPMILYLFYGFFSFFSLIYMANNWSDGRRQFIAIVAICLLNPLILLNITQVMMETPIIGLMAIAYGGLHFRKSIFKKCFLNYILSIIAIVLAITIKETALIPFAVLFFANLFFSRISAGVVLFGCLLGIAFRNYSLKYIGAAKHNYWNDNLVEFIFENFNKHAVFALSYAKAWGFYTGILLVIFLFIFVMEVIKARNILRIKKETLYTFLVLLGSLISSILVVFVSVYPMLIRYSYPAMLLGILALAIAIVKLGKIRYVWITLIVQIYFVSQMYMNNYNKFRDWPFFTVRELYHSGGTLFSGVPLYWWLSSINVEGSQSTCLKINQNGGEEAFRAINIVRHFLDVSPTEESYRVFDETKPGGFEGCPGRKIIVDQRHVDIAAFKCTITCPDWARYQLCLPKPVTFYSTREDISNETLNKVTAVSTYATQLCM